MKIFKGMDHIAIVIPDTEEALKIWRDRFGFPVLFSETVADGKIMLTHLDMGNMHLQLVQPLTEEQPLSNWLEENGPGLHHICLSVDNIDAACEKMTEVGLESAEQKPHQGTQGKRALFLDRRATAGVQVELTGA